MVPQVKGKGVIKGDKKGGGGMGRRLRVRSLSRETSFISHRVGWEAKNRGVKGMGGGNGTRPAEKGGKSWMSARENRKGERSVLL